MPIFKMEKSWRRMTEADWYAWIKQHRRSVVSKTGLFRIEHAAKLLNWHVDAVRRRAELVGQRSFWLFEFEDGIYVYPSEVLKMVKDKLEPERKRRLRGG